MSVDAPRSRAEDCPDDARIAAWLEGSLDAGARDTLERHLDTCPSCRRLVATAAGEPGVAAAPTPLPRGTSYARYVVLDVVGAGGMGVVYAAYDPELDRRVAVKVLHPGRARGDAALRARIQREAQAMARIAHPSVVAVYDVGLAGGDVFVVMEYVPGTNLGAWLKAAPRAPAEVLAVFRRAGEGLAAAHAAGIVHRDFKPENVLLGPDHRVAVTDFGLAATQGESAPEARPARATPAGPLTRTGAILGTPAYMAPEQHDGRPTDARTDLFSYCVALWEALYGERPYKGETLAEIRAAIDRGPPTEPAGGARLPARVRKALQQGLAAEPAARPESMAALLDALAPSRTPRRLAAAAAALVLTAGAAGATAWYQGAPERACEAAGAPLQSVWSPALRDEITKAFGPGEAARDALQGVLARLDGWAGEWAGMRRDVCLGARVRQDLTPEVAAARHRCLDRRLEELRALGRLLSVPDSDLATAGRKAAWALAPVSRCADVDALLAPVPLPEDPAQRAAVDEAFRALAELDALRWAGRYAAGLKQATALAERATTLGHQPLTSEALERLGDFRERTGDFPGAAESLQAAVLAAERGRDVRRAAYALAEVVWVEGHQRSNRALGFEAAKHADALLEGVGGDLEIGALVASNRAAVLLDEGRTAEALTEFERALAARRALFGEMHPQVAIALSNVGTALLRAERHADAAPFIERAASVYAATVGDFHPLSAHTLINLADVERGLGRFDEARHHAELARQRVEGALGAEHPLVGSAENMLGILANEQRRFEDARRHLTKALAIAERSRGPEHPFTAHYGAALGEALAGLGDHAGAIERERRAIALYEKLGDDVQRGRALYVLGRSEAALGRLAEGRAHLEASLRLAEKPGLDAKHLAEVRAALAQLGAR